MDFKQGELIDGRYTVLDAVGAHGGMGCVYKVKNRLDEIYALKVFDPSPEFIERLKSMGCDATRVVGHFRKKFIAEARLLSKITKKVNGTKFARVHDLNDSGDAPFYVMDYVVSVTGSPKSLRDVINESKFESETEQGASDAPGPDRIAKWFLELTEQLAALHENGFVHRDIKPENILLDENAHAVLVDFGLVEEVSDSPRFDDSMSMPQNFIVGTGGYIAPEVKNGGKISAKADLFALGAVFWELWKNGQRYKFGDNYSDFFDGMEPEPECMRCWQIVFEQLLESSPQKRCGNLRELSKVIDCIGNRDVTYERKKSAACFERNSLVIGAVIVLIAFVCLSAINTNRWNAIMRIIRGAIPVVEVQTNQERRQDVVTNQAELVQPIVIDRPAVFTNKNWTPPAPLHPGQSAIEVGRTNATPVHAASEETRNVDLRTAANQWLRKNDIALGRSVFFNTTNVVVVGTASGDLPKYADRNEREILRNRLFRQAVFACSQAAFPVGSTGCETIKHFHRIVPKTDDKSEFEVLLIMRFYSGRQRSQRGRDLVNGWIAGLKKVDLQGPHRYIDCEGNLCGVGGVSSLDGDTFDEQLKRESRQMARIALGAPITVEWVENGPIMDESDTVVLGGYDQYGRLAAFSDSDSDPEAVSVFSICKHKDSDEGFDPSAAAGKVVLKTPTVNPKGYKSAAEQVRSYLVAKGIREGFNSADGSVVLVETDAFDCPDPRQGGQLFMQIEDAVLNAYRQAHVAILNVIGQNLTDEMYARAGIPQENRDRLRDVDWSLQGWERIRESLKIIALHGVKTVREEQSWNAETKKYEVALAFQWNPNAEREMKNLSMSSLSVDMPGKYSVMSWLEAQFDLDLVTSTGPLRYVDDKGDCWFIGVGVRGLNLEEEAIFPDGCKMNSKNAAQMMVRVSLYGGMTLFEKGKEIEVDRATANERTNAAVVNGLKVALRHCREKVAHHGMRIIYQGKLKHVLSGKETIVTVAGIRASEVDFSNWMPIENRPRRLRIEEEPSEELRRKMRESDLRFRQLERNFEERTNRWN